MGVYSGRRKVDSSLQVDEPTLNDAQVIFNNPVLFEKLYTTSPNIGTLYKLDKTIHRKKMLPPLI